MFLGWVIFLVGISISFTSAFFSIVGLLAIFPGAFYTIVTMGIVLELGKIASVVFLHNYWKQASKLLKSYLLVTVFVLMCINSIGIFGGLSKFHLEQELLNSDQSYQVEIVDSKIDNENSIVKDLDTQISQIDNTLVKLTQLGQIKTAIYQAAIQKKARDSLVSQKNDHLKTIQSLREEKVKEEQKNDKLEIALGPLKYIASLIYTHPTKEQFESTVRMLILCIVIAFDPLALFLLIASQTVFQFSKKKYLTNVDKNEIMDLDKHFDGGK